MSEVMDAHNEEKRHLKTPSAPTCLSICARSTYTATLTVTQRFCLCVSISVCFVPGMLFQNLLSVVNDLAWIALFTPPVLLCEVHMIEFRRPSQKENTKGNVIDKVTGEAKWGRSGQ